jgi:hypothetical protein
MLKFDEDFSLEDNKQPGVEFLSKDQILDEVQDLLRFAVFEVVEASQLQE